ncbi:MAG: ribonuclease III [Lachnospiraceae bacterium]|nr:ribonuclease III [Lachnospiraceae bacterium]
MSTLGDLEARLGYSFRDKSLLVHALTHSSYVNEHGLRKQDCNERLEFFGDAILEMIASRHLYQKYPEFMEGELSKRRANCVSERGLAKAARSLDLGDALFLGRGMEESGGRTFDSVLSDAFEALLAALYLDGGLEIPEKIILDYVLVNDEDKLPYDEKTSLQELVQKSGKSVRYELVSEEGPEHERRFTYRVIIGRKPYGEGTGRSKKEAQSNAAEKTLEMIRNQ